MRLQNKIAIVTGEAEGLRDALVSGEPTPIEYPTPKPATVTDEDKEIASFPLAVSAEHITIVPVDSAFER